MSRNFNNYVSPKFINAKKQITKLKKSQKVYQIDETGIFSIPYMHSMEATTLRYVRMDNETHSTGVIVLHYRLRQS